MNTSVLPSRAMRSISQPSTRKFRVRILYPNVLRTYRAATFSPWSPSGFLTAETSFIRGLKLRSFFNQGAMAARYPRPFDPGQAGPQKVPRQHGRRTKNPARVVEDRRRVTNSV